MRLKALAITGVRRMDIKSELQPRSGMPRQLDEFSELVHLAAKCLSLVFEKAIRAAPARHRCELLAFDGVGHGPIVQNDRLSNMQPVDAARRNAAFRPPDVLAEREIDVVMFEPRAGVALGIPDLRERRIEIDIRFAPAALRQVAPCQVACDVHQESAGFRGFLERTPAHAVDFRAVIEDQSGAIGNAKRRRRSREVGEVSRFAERRRRASRIDAVLAPDLFDEAGGHAEVAKAAYPAQHGPHIAAVAGLIGQCPADYDSGHGDRSL
jgi:hypothetical protein